MPDEEVAEGEGKPMNLRLPAPLLASLQDLVRAGFGTNPTAVARYLVTRGVQEAIRDQVIKSRGV
jgi:hypothetical protein